MSNPELPEHLKAAMDNLVAPDAKEPKTLEEAESIIKQSWERYKFLRKGDSFKEQIKAATAMANMDMSLQWALAAGYYRCGIITPEGDLMEDVSGPVFEQNVQTDLAQLTVTGSW